MSTGPVHTYGPTCLRATPKQDLVALRSSSEPPKVHAHFFYTSSLPIDDPLTPLPAPTSAPRSAGGRQPMSTTDLVIRSAAQSLARSVATQLAREGGKILRNQLGSILGGGR